MATKYGPKASDKVEKAMHEAKHGELKSGRSGKKVTSRKQAIAIGLSEARHAGAKVPSRKSSSSSSSTNHSESSSRPAAKSSSRSSSSSSRPAAKSSSRSSSKRSSSSRSSSSHAH